MSAGERLTELRAAMQAADVDIYLVPSGDPHMSEYVPSAWQRRAWLSGFTGSAGDVAVGRDGAWLWTDGRYWLQADAELDGDHWTLMKDGAPDVLSLTAWLGTRPAGTRVGVDPRLVSVKTAKAMRAALTTAGGTLVAVDHNLVDVAWKDQPALPSGAVAVWPERYAGRSVAAKLEDIRAALTDARADTLVLSTLDAIAWLFNIRGADVDFNPVVVAYALVGREEATLYVAAEKIPAEAAAHLERAGVRVAAYEAFADALSRLAGRVWIDKDHASLWIQDQLRAAGCDVHQAMSPAFPLRAVKNATELAGMRAAHVRDGVAVCRYLHWLESAWQGGDLDEIAASDQLERFRAEGEGFRGLSFDTISGFESNGAVIHYRATPRTAKVLDDSALYLVDSGGQYLDGTTDITRTVHLGTPTDEERDRYTRVLKGHLALRRARFPKGTTGSQLDVLARLALWDVGLNYAHGTGHGVGCYLSVHQGPHRIAHKPNTVGLEPGMIVSNEPGYYKDGAYGIRIENLVVVVPAEVPGDATFFGFDDLTMAPYCRKLIDVALLDDTERAQVDAYHARVREAVGPHLDDDVRAWLDGETAPL